MVKASCPQEKLSVRASKGHGCQSDIRILSRLPACARGQRSVLEIIVSVCLCGGGGGRVGCQ